MKELFPIDGKTDEELMAEYSEEIDGRTFVPARLLDAIGERQVRMADRKPGDPGTVENPIFKEGKAYVYGKRNKLILWEDYEGPDCKKEPFYRLTANVQEASDEESAEILEEIKGLTDNDLSIASAERFAM